MTITPITGADIQITESSDLERLLRMNRSGDYAAFVMQTPESSAEFWIHMNGDRAFVTYFPTTDGSHPGFQPEAGFGDGSESTSDRSVTFLQVGESWADRIEMPLETTVSVAQAVVAASEFLLCQDLPPSIKWFEL